MSARAVSQVEILEVLCRIPAGPFEDQTETSNEGDPR